tara:strand:+ start:8270 stop:10708 length:2439 start_codon:yes stop_codon:yes gene_type:complete
MALFDTPRMGASGTGTGYQIERSLRFDGSNGYLTRTPSSTGNRKVWTWSGWIKRGHLNNEDYLFSCNSQSGNDGIAALYFKSGNNRLQFYFDTDGSNPYGDINSRDYRDPTAWYHIVWQVDAANTSQRIWVNGVEENVTGGNPPNYDYAMNRSGYAHAMGSQGWDGHTNRADMYMAEVHYSDGNKYEASDFGEYDSETGVWSPKENVNITYGTNGFYLKFNDNSSNTATTIGKDSSGNGNNWTPNGISVSSGVGNDSVEDTPTNNFCTLNPLDKHSSVTLTNANLQTATTATAGHYPVFSTMSMKGGKWYVEAHLLTNDGFLGSIMNIEHDNGSLNIDSTVGNNTSSVNKVGYGLLTGNGKKSHNGTLTDYGSAISGSDVWMCAFDADNGKIWWGKNGTWFASGDPAAGSNAAYTGIDTSISWNFAWHHYGNNNNVSVNFGQQGFTHTPPNGFKALCTANLPDPTIKQPNKHFGTVLYTGTGSSQNITGLEFQPDWVSAKRRDGTASGNVLDSVRGVRKHIEWDSTDSEQTEDAGKNLTSFNSDGFTLGGSNSGSGRINWSGNTFVAWNWKAGGSTVTNNDGNNTSQVRANTSAGFSIVSYTGNGTNNSNVTMGHGLGVKPDLVIIKNRDASKDWVTWHKNLGTHGTYVNNNIFLNSSGAENYYSDQFREANASTFAVRSVDSTNGKVNKNGDDYIAYCFSGVEGYSKFGSYTGNGSTNGTFVFTGFRPAFVISKRTDSTSSWQIWDNKRDIDNPTTHRLRADLSNAEDTGSVDIDLLSNGFKLRNTGINQNNGTYLYLAFAESPFKYARAR